MQSNTVFINTEEELIAHVNSLPPIDQDAVLESVKISIMMQSQSDCIWAIRVGDKKGSPKAPDFFN